LDSEIRVAFDRLLDLAGIRPIILAEVDDMAMLRLLARESEGVTLVPPIVVRDELDSGVLIEHCRIPQLEICSTWTSSFCFCLTGVSTMTRSRAIGKHALMLPFVGFGLSNAT
jgi:DNA-binding transcriptional LysR family regulator